MNIIERMKSGLLYFCDNPELIAKQAECNEILYDFNQTRPSQMDKRQEILTTLLGGIGSNCYIEPPLHANWGSHTYLGDNVYANFNLTLVDDAEVHIGSFVMIGPNVTIATAGHPIEPAIRRKVGQFNLPVYIGDNVWIGAGAVILPGVHIGENSVIGAGSIVTRDIPANVVAVGNPCRVLREFDPAQMAFETLEAVDVPILSQAFVPIDIQTVIKAAMGTSPDMFKHLQLVYPDLNLEAECRKLFPQPVEAIEAAQRQLLRTIFEI